MWPDGKSEKGGPEEEAWVRYYERYFDRKEDLKTDSPYRELYRGFKDSEKRRDYSTALCFATAIWYAWYGFNRRTIDEGGD